MTPAFIGSFLFSLTVVLYILLLFGAPLGGYAMGASTAYYPRRAG